jgi:hypothetical protein
MRPVLALSLALLCPRVAPAPPAPQPKPLLPEPPPLKAGTVFAGQPGKWRLNWYREYQGGSLNLHHLAAAVATLGRDGSWAVDRGGWQGRWSWNPKTRTLFVRESRDGKRWLRWHVTFRHAAPAGLFAAFGPNEGGAEGLWMRMAPRFPTAR